MTFRVAMDIGGTFTDVVCYDEQTGAVLASKAPTTPGDLAEGVFAALGRVVDETATTVIPPGCLATVDANGFLIIKVTS